MLSMFESIKINNNTVAGGVLRVGYEGASCVNRGAMLWRCILISGGAIGGDQQGAIRVGCGGAIFVDRGAIRLESTVEVRHEDSGGAIQLGFGGAI